MSQGNNTRLASAPGQLTSNEKVNLWHIIHKKKVRVERLEEVLDARVKGFSEEHKKNYQTILKQESEIAQLKRRLQDQEDKSKLDYTSMVDKYEKQIASYQVGLMFQTPGETQSGSELQAKVDQLEEQIRQRDTEEKLAKAESQAENQRKVDQLEEQIRQRDTEILELSNQKESQSQELTQTKNMLLSMEAKYNLMDCPLFLFLSLSC